ncbi:MAG: cold-shock protein [Alphaproteobacteria bacterium]|nr:cold-shock protein [Alphaproteobacteria bacterium]
MAIGTVKWFNKAKGFGFIAPDEGGDDVFVHISAVKAAGLADLQEDQQIGFELVEGPNGRMTAGSLSVVSAN